MATSKKAVELKAKNLNGQIFAEIQRLLPEVAICIGPEHADTMVRDGIGIREIQDYLFARAGNRRSALTGITRDNFPGMAPFDEAAEDPFVPIVSRPEDYLLFVAGGVGKHSMAMPSFGLTRSVTKAIDPP